MPGAETYPYTETDAAGEGSVEWLMELPGRNGSLELGRDTGLDQLVWRFKGRRAFEPGEIEGVVRDQDIVQALLDLLPGFEGQALARAAESPWLYAGERLPDIGEEVLFCMLWAGKILRERGRFRRDPEEGCYFSSASGPCHPGTGEGEAFAWMPLPEPPPVPSASPTAAPATAEGHAAPKPEVIDLMAALRASLAAERKP